MRVAHRIRYVLVPLTLIFSIAAMSEIWAAPGCVDADSDTFDKYHRKWCPTGDDPDDNDPCVVPEGESPDPGACDTGGGGGDTGPDPYNLARASFATRAELAYEEDGSLIEPLGGVFADNIDHCGPYDYWDWQDTYIFADVNPNCLLHANSSNVSGGGRWFLISSPAGSDEVIDVVERWLEVDFSDPSDPDSPSPCFDLDNGNDPELGIPLYLMSPDVEEDQIVVNAAPCIDNVSVRLPADRILKEKANYQQLEFSIRHRPDPEASIYWSPWGYVSYINPLYLWDSPDGNAAGWTNCRVMSTRSGPDALHDRAEAELLLETGAGQTRSLGSYNLPMEVCVTRASD